MSDIRNYGDLLTEKARLEIALATQKKIIHQGFIELKEEYKPAIDLLGTVSKITHRSISNPLVNMGINLVGEIFLKNVFLSRSNRIVQFTVPFLAKKALGFMLSKGVALISSRQRKRRIHEQTAQPAKNNFSS